MRSIKVMFISIVFVLLLSACIPTEGPPPAGISETPSSANSPLPKDTPKPAPSPVSVQVSAAMVEELAAGNGVFAYDLYRSLRGREGNLFYSPYSISSALAMVYAGARGDTAQQMAAALHYGLPQDQLHAAFQALSQELDSDQDFQLSIANSLWGQEGYPFLPAFLDLIAQNYAAALEQVDFVDEASREQARQRINDWVLEQTQGKIEELLGRGALTQDTRLVLVNAIYFLAEWETPFLDGTNEGNFTLLDGRQVVVPMMSRRTETPYAEAEGVQAVEIPYKGGRMSMLVLLPAEGEFESFEASLDAERVRAILESMQSNDLQLSMPKFSFSAEFSLGGTLAGMGMADAFDAGRADLSGIDGTQSLYITDVVHKAFVAVDEMGTEAAAATGVVVGITSMPQTLQVDRPFIFVIRDAETGSVLFIGRVLDPTS